VVERLLLRFAAFLPGEQFGNAIADLIYGDAIPQAKLPVTFPKVRHPSRKRSLLSSTFTGTA
jgi:hypothetical protein